MSRYSIWIVSPPNYLHSHAFDEVAIGLHAGFRALGLDAEVVHDSSRLGDVTIVLGCNLLKAVAPPPPDKRLILFNLEQITPNSAWLTQDYLALLGRYPVWDYSQGNIAELARMGIKAQHCGIGYAPELTRIAPAPEDIDVLFVGSVNERRLIVLKQLAAQGINVDARFNLYGAERDAFVARARIVLNVHFYDARLFEIVRVSYLLANRNASCRKPAPTPRSKTSSGPASRLRPMRRSPKPACGSCKIRPPAARWRKRALSVSRPCRRPNICDSRWRPCRGPAATPFRGVDFDPIGIISTRPSRSRAPSIAASEQRAGCGARQWHRGGAPGGAGPYVTGPARPKAATPGNRGPAVARAEPRLWVR